MGSWTELSNYDDGDRRLMRLRRGEACACVGVSRLVFGKEDDKRDIDVLLMRIE